MVLERTARAAVVGNAGRRRYSCAGQHEHPTLGKHVRNPLAGKLGGVWLRGFVHYALDGSDGGAVSDSDVGADNALLISDVAGSAGG